MGNLKECLAHEIMVIDRTDKEFVNTYMDKLVKPALYILVNRETNKLYIGETEDSLKRLRNHETKEFWTEAIVFHSKMNTLSTTEVRWLEAKTYDVVSELGYFDLTENIKKPNYPPLKEDQDIELEPVFEEAKRYICAAGFDIFMKKDKANPKDITLPFKDDAEPTKVNTWLICYDKNLFKVDECFKKYGQIYWHYAPSLKGIKAGDIAYLYSGVPDKAIRYKVEVVAAHLPYNKDMDREDEFKKEVNHDEDKKKESFLVKPLASTKAASLTLQRMIDNGLMSKRPSHSQLSQDKFKERLAYIEQHFDDKEEWSDTPKSSKKAKPQKKAKGASFNSSATIAHIKGDGMVFTQVMKQAGGSCKLTFYRQEKKYVINKGSNILDKSYDSCSKSMISFREHIKANGRLSRKEGKLYTLLEDILLPENSTPSTASQFCWGTSRPGPDDWKDENGKSYPTKWWKE